MVIDNATLCVSFYNKQPYNISHKYNAQRNIFSLIRATKKRKIHWSNIKMCYKFDDFIYDIP